MDLKIDLKQNKAADSVLWKFWMGTGIFLLGQLLGDN